MRWIVGGLVLVVLSFTADAQSRRTLLESHRDWLVYAHNTTGVFIAETVNESGAIFGVVCDPQNSHCYWAIISDSSCKQGGEYPALVNSRSGAFPVVGTCISDNQMRFAEFGELLSTVSSDPRVAFAVPLENGLFRVTRFSLDGALNAGRRAAELATEASGRRTGDMLL